MAEIDPIDAVHGTTPIHWAWWGGSRRAVDALAPFSRDVWTLTWAGKLDRLGEVLATEPALAIAGSDDVVREAEKSWGIIEID